MSESEFTVPSTGLIGLIFTAICANFHPELHNTLCARRKTIP